MPAADSGRVLLPAFLVSMAIVSLPVKNLAYVAPAAFVVVLLWRRDYGLVCRMSLLASAVLGISLVTILWDHLRGQAVSIPGACLALITYAPLLLLLSDRFDRRIDRRTYGQLVTICAWFVCVQSAVGLFQYLATGNPDAVCGTFGLLDGFRHTITISQVYFTFTMFGMILFLLPVAGETLPRAAITVGVLTCVVAQSGHQTIFFAASLAFCGTLRITSPGAYLRTVGGALAIGVLVACFFPDTLWLSREWLQKVSDDSNSPKRLVVEGAARVMAEPKNFMIGAGLGQYSSRAALITSNEYLGVKLPSMMTGTSAYFDDYVLPSMLLFEEIGEGSAIAKPYMSAVSLPVELGAPLTLALLAVVVREVARCVRAMRSESGEAQWIGFAGLAGILFFLLCCLVENYAEFAQAVFLPFLLYISAASRAGTILRARTAEGSSGKSVRDVDYRLITAPAPLPR